MHLISRRQALKDATALAALASCQAFGGTAGIGPNPQASAPGGSLTPFALNMYGQLSGSSPETNVFCSPLSIVEAVGMVLAGAAGQTADEISTVLGVELNRFPAVIANVNEILLGKDRPYTVSLANALWVDANFPLKKDYQKLVESKYSAAGENCNFTSEPERERQRINAWVSEKTKDKIKDLMPGGSINVRTRVVITNAIYFNAQWARQFDKSLTKDADFTLDTAGKKVTAKFMNGELSGLPFYEDEHITAIDLPYKGNTASMLVMLPRDRGAAELFKTLSPLRFQNVVASLRPTMVNVSMPRFKLETSYDLIGALRSLGIQRAFAAGGADFSGISDVAKAQELYISTVVHKAFIDVNEERTEAAGATGISVVTGGLYRLPPKVFTADHPFIFAVRDRKSSELLFMGRVSNPA